MYITAHLRTAKKLVQTYYYNIKIIILTVIFLTLVAYNIIYGKGLGIILKQIKGVCLI